MGLFYRRPAAGTFAAFIFASLLGFFISDVAKLAAVTLSVIAAGCAAFFALYGGRRSVALMSAALAVAVSLGMAAQWAYFDVYYSRFSGYVGEQITVSANVISRDFTNSYSSGYYIRIFDINGKPCRVKATLSCEYLSELQPGYSFRMTAEVLPMSENTGEGLWRYSELSEGVMLKLRSTSEEDYDITDEDAFDIEYRLATVNRRLGAFLRRSIPGQQGELAVALLLGDRDGLDASVTRDFSRSGVSHLLALSGLHFSIMIGLCGLLLGRLGVPRTARCVLLLVAIFGYLALIGFSASACRAAIMLAAVYCSFFFSARADSVTSLFGAAALIIFISPSSVLDVGLWLSVLATLGIILGLPLLDEFRSLLLSRTRSRRARHILARLLEPMTKYLLVPVVGTVAANAATCLVVWLAFGKISVYSVITNVILSPMVGAVLLIGVMMLAFSWLPWLAGLLGALGGTVTGWMLSVSEYFGRRTGGVVSLRYDFAGVIILLLTLTVTVLALIRLRHRWLAMLPAPAAVAAFVIALTVFNTAHAGEVEVTYLRDKGNETLVAVSEGGAVIVDMSDGSYGSLYRGMRRAEKDCAVEVSALVLTHYHQRHISSVDRFCRTELVERIFLPFPLDDREYYIMWSIVYDAERNGCAVEVYRSGESVAPCAQLDMTVWRGYLKRSTHPTTALRLRCGDEALTYVGTSVHEGETYAAVSEAVAGSTEVIFGAHGPVLKSRFSYPLSPRLRDVVFATAEAISYFDREATELPDCLWGPVTSFHIRLGEDFSQSIDKIGEGVYNSR